MSQLTPQITHNDPKWIKYKIEINDYHARNAKITAVVLGIIALFLIAFSCVLFGLGTVSPTFLMGLGIFPYLGGAMLSYIAIGILCGMFICTVISAVRTYQKEKWHAKMQEPQQEIS